MDITLFLNYLCVKANSPSVSQNSASLAQNSVSSLFGNSALETVPPTQKILLIFSHSSELFFESELHYSYMTSTQLIRVL